MTVVWRVSNPTGSPREAGTLSSEREILSAYMRSVKSCFRRLRINSFGKGIGAYCGLSVVIVQ